MTHHLHRSALYVPADHDRAMAKAASLDADILIFDLEDGVAPERKALAREAIQRYLNETSFSQCTLVRINHRDTDYYQDDIAAFMDAPLDGIMLSKTGGPEDVDDIVSHLSLAGRGDVAIWANVETPRGVANVMAIAAHAHIAGMVAGTNDLANDLRIRPTADRAGLMHSLQQIHLAARAYGRIVLDGTFVDLEDMEGLKREAEQGRMLGFDGKTLIHPKQIAITNEVFGPSQEELEEASAIIEAYELAMREQKAVTMLGTRMIERLHYDRAKELLCLADPTPN